MIPRVFVTGTGTDVGKTLVSGILAKVWSASYWKPVQAGITPTTDSRTVAAWIGRNRVLREARVLELPASPNQAAQREGVRLDLDDFELPDVEGPLVVEGAGGLMVPINGEHMMIDLIAKLKLPVALVAHTGLGTLNHTLLSIEALRSRGLETVGVVLNGDLHPENRRDIEHFGKVPVWGRLPVLETVDVSDFSPIYASWKVTF
ncbi:MAG: dethiobiotin synthase [Acidobacteriota bacterium]|nr:dethiobiotin synthase [Acidobacteriota bacterium]